MVVGKTDKKVSLSRTCV